jgi:THO complex subunit 2
MNSPNAIPVQPRLSNLPAKPTSPALTPSKSSTEPRKDTALQTPAMNTAATQAPKLELEDSVLFEYEHITEPTLASWADIGRRSIVEVGIQARISNDALTLSLLFQELVRSGLDGRISATDAGKVVKEILGEDNTDGGAPVAMVKDSAVDASSQFLDCLSIFAEAASTTPTLNTSLNTMILATGISPSKMRLELETTLLVSLGMIRSTFVRAGIRQITNLLYRQSNYNLLREETEGYSKLVTELFTTSSNEPPTSEVVEETFERVKGMIGAFDLDVGRVLDITLDVFAAVLVKQYRFFVKYLRASSWWPQDKPIKSGSAELALDPLPRWALPGSSCRPLNDQEKEAATAAKAERDRAFWERSKQIGMAAFFELGGRRAEGSALIAATNGTATESNQDDEDRKWIEITKTLPPSGNKVAAQVLGFKLRFYSSSARDPVEVLPLNLIYLAALLIKVGFISLRDLYPHIWPADSDMEVVREEKMKEKAERERLNRPGGGALNALLAAAPLPDDTIDGREFARLREADAARRNAAKVDQTTDRATPAAQPEEKADELPEPSEQKIQLLKSLLCIGALPEALYMLGRFPWLPDAFLELPEHIHRILHHSLSKVYEPLRPLNDHSGLRDLQKLPDPDQAGAVKGGIKFKDAPARKTMRWAQLDKEDTNEAIDYKFYWDDWADSVPVCQNVDDVFTLCSSLLNLTGVKIGQDAALLLKLVRIGSHSLAVDTSDFNLSRWIDLSKRVIVPAVSLTKCKPGAVNEVFELINKFSTPTRYNIYAEWYSGQTSRLPDMKAAFDQAKAETKDVLKRISKTTLKPMARALSKVAYANPGIVFSVAIAQLESYDNIVDAVVDCARYFTFLAYDVLIWSLMSALGGTGRNRVQTDGMLTSKWLAALSLFAGKVFKKYSVLNPTPIIQYVADQLRRGNSTDLIILEEITRSMAGIISDTNFNEAQVLAMAGGELLQAQTLLQLFDQRHESKTTAKRLMRSLTDSRLAGQILVSLAQERQTGIYRIEEQNAHPKLLGNLADQLHRILVQYTDLLRSNLSVKDFDYFVPGVARLVTEFGIDPSIAFWISRPSIANAVAEYDAKNGKRKSEACRSPAKKSAEGSIKAEFESAADKSSVNETANPAAAEDAMDVSEVLVNGVPNADQGDTDIKNAAKLSPTTSPPPAKTELIQQPWHPILQELMDAIRPALPDETWEILSLPFYVTFWSLSLSDMDIAATSYQDENMRQQKKIKAISDDRQDVTRIGTARKDLEKKAISDLQDLLSRERESRVGVYASVRKRMMKERNHWFPGTIGNWEVFNVTLIEQCFFPRIVISPLDALYTFKMLTFLHTSGATNFRTMGVLDQFFKEKRLTSMMFLCTAKEAENIGRFLNEMLRYLSRWHINKKDYEKEAFGVKKDLPGFTKRMGSDKSQYAFLEYEDFRRLLLKWHRNLSFAIKVCIGSGEYMHIRNAVNVLNNINQHFPAVNWMGKGLLDSITELNKSESREDLKVAAMSLMGALKRREKDWVLPQAFSLVSISTSSKVIALTNV